MPNRIRMTFPSFSERVWRASSIFSLRSLVTACSKGEMALSSEMNRRSPPPSSSSPFLSKKIGSLTSSRVSLMDQIHQRETLIDVTLRDEDHQTQVRPDHLLTRPIEDVSGLERPVGLLQQNLRSKEDLLRGGADAGTVGLDLGANLLEPRL